MKTALRSVGGVFAGLAAALVVVVAVEMYSAVVHPTPPDFGGTMEETCRHVENYPAWVLATVVPLWAGAGFLGAWVAGRLGNVPSAVLVAVLLVAAVAWNVSMLPYPLWFEIAIVASVSAAVAAGVYRSRGRPTAYATGAE